MRRVVLGDGEFGGSAVMKKTLAGVLGVGVVGALGLSAWSVTGDQSVSRRDHVKVPLKDVTGKQVAEVDIDAVQHGGNRVTVHAWNLTPGFHAVHIHAIGVCDPAGAKPFASAGGHFNPTGASEGMQAGALPVLLAGADGEGQAQFLDGNFAIPDLFGASGAAIVIHAAPDNYANIPNRYAVNGVAGPDADTQTTGDAGARFACGLVSAPQATASGSPPAATPS
jgi:Cu-Zn family superoxide dismutase